MLSALNQYANISNYTGSADPAVSSRTSSGTVDSKSAADKSQRQRTSQVQTLPGQDKTKPDGSPRDAVELSSEAQEIRKMQLRDREVRAHEAAHATAGGGHAGSPSYTFERGPDGQTYAVAGSVSIDIAPIKGDPEATLQKAQQIRAAALAPANPSAQDMKVAQKAQTMAASARSEIAQQLNDDLKSIQSEVGNKTSNNNKLDQATTPSEIPSADSSNSNSSSVARLDIYT